MADYAYPTGTAETSSMVGFFQYINSVTNGLFFPMMVVAIFIILGISYYNARKSYEEAFAVSGILTTIIALFFRMANLISIPFFVTILGIAVVSGIILMIKRN